MIIKKFYKSYESDLAKIEKLLFFKKNEIITEINKKIKATWQNIFNIDEIFDFEIGAVKFEDFEWKLLKNNKFKSIYEEKYFSSYLYMMEKDFSKLLRGSYCYYYLVCEKPKSKKTSNIEAKQWLTNIRMLLNKFLSILSSCKTVNDTNKKLFLSVCDHLRLYLILLLNLNIAKINNKNNYLYNLNKLDTEVFYISQYLTELHKLINNTLFDNKINIKELEILIKNSLNSSYDNINEIDKLNPNIIIQSFKIHRELDCYIENYISIQYCLKNYTKNIADKKFVGIMNGGIELPYILAESTKTNLDNICFINLNNNKLYLDRHNDNLNIEMNNCKDTDYILLDDNALTGHTLQKSYNVLKNNINHVDIFLVRHPNLNRVEQCRIYNQVLNLKNFNKIIFGMLFDSPFSRLKENTNYENEYLDELGVFTKTGYSFLKCLYKNGMFKKFSEVYYIKGVLNKSIWKE